MRFPGEAAGASLKLRHAGHIAIRAGHRFPRRSRRGLLEARGASAEALRGVTGFPGEAAGASLKPPRSAAINLCPQRRFPRRSRRGLIEASMRRISYPIAAQFPRRSRRGLIEATGSARSPSSRIIRVSPAKPPGPHSNVITSKINYLQMKSTLGKRHLCPRNCFDRVFQHWVMVAALPRKPVASASSYGKGDRTWNILLAWMSRWRRRKCVS